MMKFLNLLKKHRVGKRILSLLLCIMTVICFGGVLAPTQAHAVAGVDDAIYFIVAFLICCGMTFASTSAATNAAQQFYVKAPPSVQDIIDYQAEQLQKDTALPLGIIEVLKSDWKALIDEFMAQFPQYCNIDVDYTNILNQQLTDGMSFYQTLISDSSKTISFDVPWYDDSFVTTQLSTSSTLTFCTTSNLSRVVGDSIYNSLSTYFPDWNLSSCQHLAVFSVPTLNLSSFFTLGYRQFNTPYITQRFYKSVDVPGYLMRDGLLLQPSIFTFFYKDELCTLTSTSTGLLISTATYGNIISDMLSDDVISPNDNLINCDDLTITSANLMKLFYGEDVFGVGVDAAHIPGIDSFPSTTGDITDVSTYPDSIGISVPRDLSDTITKTAEDIRTVDQDKTDTDDKTDTKPGDSKPNKPSIPGLSLPEILFKEKFPFCLPWDVYNVFVNLVSEPEAPVFTIPFKFQRLGIDYEFTIDLSQFDDIAKVSRFFSSIAFVIFLILASRKLIGAE